MSLHYEAAFFDIDGTLFSYKSYRYIPSTLAAIKRFQEEGGKAFISTARCYALVKSFGTLNLGIRWDGVCAFEGGVVLADHQFLRNDRVPPSLMKRFCDLVIKEGYNAELLYPTTRYLLRPMEKWAKAYYSFFVDPVPSIRKYTDVPANGAILIGPESARATFEKAIPELEFNWFIDAGADVSMPSGRDKGAGVSLLLKHFGIPKEKAIAFGDSVPDVEMKKAVDKLVIVANGREEAKQAADLICPEIDEDGIAKTMDELVFSH